MPISIPTSIAGISVPGTINGPLQLLYGNKYDRATYNYPRNLGADATRSHVIKFTVMKPDPAYKSELATNVMNIANGIIQGGGENLIEGKFSQGVLDNTKAVINDISASDVPRIAGDSIALYVPDTVNVSYGAQYDDISLTESLGKAYFLAQAGTSMIDLFKQGGDKTFEQLANKVGSDPFLRKAVADAVGKKLGMNNLGDLALRGIGQAMNPQLQVLFRGVGFRTFQFDFVFTPYSKEETEIVNKIIKAFKLAAAPEINATAYFSQGLFMKVPDPFMIQFFYKGQENPYVHKIGETVLENINVDYGPNGWATFNDGSPVQIKMTLQFKETVIVDKNRINAGY
jgi:hypothetical protein